jgi:predicted Fe-Mo cluster-binding NifX family protein
MNFRAAFAATGEYIDQHFGSARYFQIYDINGGEHSQIETRKAEAKCRGNCEGGFDWLLEILNDCDAVFVSRIGQSAAAFMIGHGKRVFEAAGMVEEIIAELKKGNLLEESVQQ